VAPLFQEILVTFSFNRAKNETEREEEKKEFWQKKVVGFSLILFFSL